MERQSGPRRSPRCRYCDRPTHARGLCTQHYSYAYDHGTLNDYPMLNFGLFVPCCVCPIPDPDGLGECRHCRHGYTPGLMALRDEWIDYLDSKGVERGAGFFLVNG